MPVKLQASPASNMGTPLSTKSSSRWSKSKTAKKIMSMKECTSIVDGLKIIYFTKVSVEIKPMKDASAKCVSLKEMCKAILTLSDNESVQCRYDHWKRHTSLGTSSHLTSMRVTSMQNPLSFSWDNTPQVRVLHISSPVLAVFLPYIPKTSNNIFRLQGRPHL